MPENKAESSQKNSPIRLPDELRRALRRQAFARGEESGKEPSYATLLMEMWEKAKSWDKAKSIPNSDKAPIPAEAGKGADCTAGTYRVGGNWPEDINPNAGESLGDQPYVHIQSPGTQIQQITAEEWRWVERVLQVVRGGRPETLIPLDTNLTAFVLMTELLTGAPSGERPSVPISADDIERKMAALRAAQEALGHELEAAQQAARGARRPGKNRRRAEGGNQ